MQRDPWDNTRHIFHIIPIIVSVKSLRCDLSLPAGAINRKQEACEFSCSAGCSETSTGVRRGRTGHSVCVCVCVDVKDMLHTLICIWFWVLNECWKLGEDVHPSCVRLWVSRPKFDVPAHTHTRDTQTKTSIICRVFFYKRIQMDKDGKSSICWHTGLSLFTADTGLTQRQHSLGGAEDVLKELLDLVDVSLDLAVEGDEGRVRAGRQVLEVGGLPGREATQL